MYVFNKILIIFAKLACLSLWTQCSSAHTCKEGQRQQRSCKAHLGVKRWVFGHILHTHWGAGFWFSTSQQSKGKADVESSFPESSKQQMESYWDRISAWENDKRPWHLPCLVTPQDSQTWCCFCYSLQSSSFGRANPPRDPWWGPLCLPASALLSPCSPQQPCFSCLLFETIPGLFVLWSSCKSSGPLLIYPYHHSLIFSAESEVCICCMRGSIYKQYSGHCHYFSA